MDAANDLCSCYLPVTAQELEAHNCKSPSGYWDSAFTNTFVDDFLRSRVYGHYSILLQEYMMDHPKSVLGGTENTPPYSELRKRAAMCFVPQVRKMEGCSVTQALVEYAKTCAGCQCCLRHKLGVFEDSLQPHDSLPNVCNCVCQEELRKVNEMFRDEGYCIDIQSDYELMSSLSVGSVSSDEEMTLSQEIVPLDARPLNCLHQCPAFQSFLGDLNENCSEQEMIPRQDHEWLSQWFHGKDFYSALAGAAPEFYK